METQSLAKNTAFLYARMVLVLCISLFTTRIVLINLGIEDYGVYNVVGSIVSLFTFLQTAISSANYRYLAFAIGKHDQSLLATTFKSAALLGLLISLIVFVLAETAGLFYINNYLNVPAERFEAAYYTFQISALTCVVTTLYMPFYSNVISHERMDFFAYLSIFEAISRIVVAVSIAYSPIDDLVFYALLLLVSQVCILISYIWFSCREFPEIKKAYHQTTDTKLLREMASFSGWTLFVAVADLCAIQGINIVINLFFAPVVNAARGIAVQIQGAVDQFRGNLQTAFNPQITKRYASRQIDGMVDLMGRSARYSSFILLTISLPIIFAINDILAVWLKVVPEYTGSFVIITLIASVIDGISNPFVTAIGATGDIRKFQTVVGVIKFLTLPACYISVSFFQSPIVIFAIYLVFTLITVCVRIMICTKKMGMRFFKILHSIILPVVKFFVLGFAVCFAVHCLIKTDTFLKLIFFLSSSALLLGVVCYLLVLTPDERYSVANFIKRKI